MTPRVSVILPVRNRSDLLALALEGLAAQTFPDFEVVVIDDGSTDDSADVVRAMAARRPEFRLVQTTGVGAVAARCAGIEASHGEVLAFTDSDCVPVPEWLAAGVAAMDKGASVVQGATVPAGPVGALERSITHSGAEGLFATCNVFYSRAAYDRAGGFDRQAEDRLGFRTTSGKALGFGEDTLLGWRVARDGDSVIAPEAVVRHAVMQPEISQLLSRAWVAGGFPELVRECPEVRSALLSQGIFLGHRRVPLYLAALLLVAGQQVAAAAAVVLWGAARTRVAYRQGGSKTRRLLSIPVEMAIDATTAVALIVGSVRSRSIVI